MFVMSATAYAAPRIVVERPDGGVSIIRPTGGRHEGEADDAYLDRLRRAAVPDAVSWRVIDDSEIPQDRYFRDAWAPGDAAEPVRVPRDRAEAVHRARLLERAAEKRERWIRARMEALAVEDNPRAAKTAKALRDLRSVDRVDLTTCSSLDDIKRCVPSVLVEEVEE